MQRLIWLLMAVILIFLLSSMAVLFWHSGYNLQLEKNRPNRIYITNLQVNQRQASIIAAGDISLSRNVAVQIKKAGNPLLPFSQLDGLLKSVDFSFANLESPFSGKNYFGQTGSLIFNAPLENVKGLIEYNFKILNLANNHALDQGKIGLENTINYLLDNGIQSFGAGVNQEQAWQPQIIKTNDISIGFIGASYASFNDNGKSTNEYVARIEDEDSLKKTIANLRSQVDLIIVSMHAGTEYTTKPNSNQIKFAHAAIDYGADLIIGHHPHWIQEIEEYQDKYIFYSLGNFIFDQMWSQKTREGLLLKIDIVKNNNLTKITQIKLLPVIIENYSTPRLANIDEAQKILKQLNLTSDTLIMN